MAAVCLFLASKVCEKHQRLQKFCELFYEFEMEKRKEKQPNLQTPPISEATIHNLKAAFVALEFRLLDEMHFEVVVNLPYNHLAAYQRHVQDWDPATRKTFLKIANNFCNDSFRSQVCLVKSAENIAQACLLLAARYLSLSIHIEPDLETVSIILRLYSIV